MTALQQRDHRGRPLVKYQVDSRGRLTTKIPKLLDAIADAMVYPPKADDTPRPDRGHLGSQMRACCCEECTGRKPCHGDGEAVLRLHPGNVLWPAHYMVKEHLSYTCAVNRTAVDDDALPTELLSDMPGGRYVMAGEAAEQMLTDRDAWRRDKLQRLNFKALCETIHPRAALLGQWRGDSNWEGVDDETFNASFNAWHQTFVAAWIKWLIGLLRSHRWVQIVGNVSFDDLGRERNSVRRLKRGLNNIGSLADFIELGHSLTAVGGGGGGGIDQTLATAITETVNQYSREPRLRQARIPWKKTREARR